MEDEHPTQRLNPEALAQASRAVPVVFKRYRLVKEIGKGGMGTVWLARDLQLDEAEVALKFLKSELANDPQALHDLKQEVLNNRFLSHPNITRAYNLESDEAEPDLSRRYAISMEYVRGTSLSALKLERLKQGRLFEPEEIQQWVFQLCDAMQHAHEVRDETGGARPVVHRDIKPSNLLVSGTGELKVCDFGIGCTVAETMSRLTNMTSPSGTLPYMSPQQIAGKTPGPSHDVYSIGATVYELLTGQPPFFRGESGALIDQIKHEAPPSIAERRRELGRIGNPIPPHWEKTIADCLAKDPAQRPPSARSVRERLEGKSSAAAGTAAGARNRSWLLLATGLGLLAAGGVYYYFRVESARPLPVATPVARAVRHPAPATVPASTEPPAPPPPKLRAAVESLVAAGRITREEAALLDAALSGQHGDRERDLAVRLVDGRLASAEDWRLFTGLVVPGEPLVARLRPLLFAGAIKEEEFVWIQAAYRGRKGVVEKLLAEQLINGNALPLEKWRRQTELAPPQNRDPAMDLVRPLVAAGEVGIGEAEWIRDGLAGEKNAYEKLLAEELVVRHGLTARGWREWSEINPPEKRNPRLEAIKPLLISNRLVWPEAVWLRDALAGDKGPAEQSRAVQLVTEKSLTLGQWRARAGFSYVLPGDAPLTKASLPPALDLPLAANVSLRLLRVDPGSFARGTPTEEPGRRPNELPVENATIRDAFYLGVFEVTQAQFTAIMPRSPSFWRGNPTWPIDQVDWAAAAGSNGFVARLNRILAKQHGGTLVADLPTEEEWEYACRAGTQTTFNNGRPITNLDSDPALDLLANYNRASSGSPKPVGSFQPNAWGFYDMHGNVAEWCLNRFVHGGSWQSKAANCRVGARTQISSEAAPSNQIGFRLVLRFRPNPP